MNDESADGASTETSRIVRLELTLSGWVEQPPTADSVCHLAGFAVRVGTTIRQRCAWCGEHLAAVECDEAGLRTNDYPVRSDQTFPVGGFVRVSSEGRGVIGIIWQDASPNDACFQSAAIL